jgi:hypothetical protein
MSAIYVLLQGEDPKGRGGKEMMNQKMDLL